jgi:hypothetical protein
VTSCHIAVPEIGRPACSLVGSDGRMCQDEAADLPWRLCLRHLLEVGSHVSGLSASAAADGAAQRSGRRSFAAEARGDGGSFVYYVGVPGDLVKIGFTTNLRGRLTSLACRPSDVLALEPGGREVEQQRHADFAHLRWRRTERFVLAPDLQHHIDMLLVMHGRPVVRRYGQAPSFVRT